ncbi:MAG: hypothetical protein PHC30_08820 [Lentisphaeria bacterium]|nr:hypothetical protein [Lentisphaeria bacterium]
MKQVEGGSFIRIALVDFAGFAAPKAGGLLLRSLVIKPVQQGHGLLQILAGGGAVILQQGDGRQFAQVERLIGMAPGRHAGKQTSGCRQIILDVKKLTADGGLRRHGVKLCLGFVNHLRGHPRTAAGQIRRQHHAGHRRQNSPPGCRRDRAGGNAEATPLPGSALMPPRLLWTHLPSPRQDKYRKPQYSEKMI